MLLSNMASQAFFPKNNSSQLENLDFLVELLVDTHLILNEAILHDFEKLLGAGPDREEDLHQFLLTFPILIESIFN